MSLRHCYARVCGGVGKVEMGQRNLLWIWTHAVFDRIRLWAWSAGL